jgi:large subunit ribosomal protein L30
MSKIRITQIKSQIDRPQRQKDTLKALGLGRVNRTVEVVVNDQIKGMIAKVAHLVSVENIK